MKFKAVLFDLDGTLLDTLDDLADSMNAVLKQLGFPTHKTEAYKYFVGEGMVVLCQRALPDAYRDKTTIERCRRGMHEEYGKRWAIKTKPYVGIHELLDALTVRNIKIAVLSNKVDDFTKLTVARLLPKWHFDIITGHRRDVPRKPDPAGAIRIARQMELAPAKFVYLGDTAIDMKTAIAAGMYPVGALWGFRTKEELVKNGAKLIITRPIELLDLFLE